MNTDIAKLSLRGIGVLIVMVIITALAVAFAWQTVRIDGLRLWPFAIEGLAAKVDRLEGDNARLIAGQAISAQDHADAKAAAERDLAHKAKETDNVANAKMEPWLAAADRHIDANRVRAQTVGCPSGQAFATANDHRSANPVGAGGAAQLDGTGPAPTFAARLTDPVAVLASDVRTCTVNTIKAEAAHDWAKAISAPPAEPIAETTTPVVPR
jgi:hypothetical protein